MEPCTPYQNNHHLLTVATGSQQLDGVAISHINNKTYEHGEQSEDLNSGL